LTSAASPGGSVRRSNRAVTTARLASS
jgi:hypothetical protein